MSETVSFRRFCLQNDYFKHKFEIQIRQNAVISVEGESNTFEQIAKNRIIRNLDK